MSARAASMSAAGTETQAITPRDQLLHCSPWVTASSCVARRGLPRRLCEALCAKRSEITRRGGGVGYPTSRASAPGRAWPRPLASAASGPCIATNDVRPVPLHRGERQRTPGRADGACCASTTPMCRVHHRRRTPGYGAGTTSRRNVSVRRVVGRVHPGRAEQRLHCCYRLGAALLPRFTQRADVVGSRHRRRASQDTIIGRGSRQVILPSGRINEDNNLQYRGAGAATNPCGGGAQPPNGRCGSP